jgi:hypothetical protein
MKKLFILFLLLMSCTTINIKSNTLDSCMKEIKERIGFDNTKLSPEQQEDVEDNLFRLCNWAKNDPNLAMGILDEIRYLH